MIGILMAAGTGTRLWPMTLGTNKHLLGVHDKPMYFYPLSTLMLAGCRQVVIIVNKGQVDGFIHYLGNGSHLGIEVHYIEQSTPAGIPQGLTLAQGQVGNQASCLILGDNLFHGVGLGQSLAEAQRITAAGSAVALAYRVANPSAYAVLEFDITGRPCGIEEKPREPRSLMAVPGLYFLPPDAMDIASSLKPSPRGELEIADILRYFLDQERLEVKVLDRGTTWLDMGTIDDLGAASDFIRVVQQRSGVATGLPEEVAWRNGWLSDDDLRRSAAECPAPAYSEYLLSLLGDPLRSAGPIPPALLLDRPAD